jgi:diaminohydroxyphosphoribosylaminopyrimidine deaminase/5-amino-6-(5-phosphoribosylamino)uracil reductase
MHETNTDDGLDAPPAAHDAAWAAVLARRRDAAAPLAPSPLSELYGPLCDAGRDGSFAIGHLAQSLDGRIATNGGVSRWISGAPDLLHTHRLRALVDAVVVGVNTVLHDDPRLTVRRCAGANPVRVVIDPERRLDGSQHVFRDGAAPTLLLVAADCARQDDPPGNAAIVAVPRSGAELDPREIRRLLAQRGLRRLLIEGGGITVSRFLAAGALDRLQITLAPLLLGSGRPGIVLPEITDLRHGLRPRTRRFELGEDIMIECDFNA